MKARRDETPDMGRWLDAQRDSLATRSGARPVASAMATSATYATREIGDHGFQASGSVNASVLPWGSAQWTELAARSLGPYACHRPIPAVRVSLLPGISFPLFRSDQTAIARGEISFEMVLALTFSATRRSYAVCRFSQPCASLPK